MTLIVVPERVNELLLGHSVPQEAAMAAITNLHELYVEEPKDLWSANDQIAKALKTIDARATHPSLQSTMAKSEDGIAACPDLLKSLIEDRGTS